MRLFKLFAVVLLPLAMAAAPAVALAGGPAHETITGSPPWTDDNFCGTGETVVGVDTGIINGWEDMAFGHRRTTITNPANGAQITDSFAGGGKELDFIDDGDGAYTVISERVGVPAFLKVAHGPLLTLDAGRIVFVDHFDADGNWLGGEIFATNGPHPGIQDQNLFCDLAVPALGL